MSDTLIATGIGCLTLSSTGQRRVDFADRQVNALTLAPDGACLVVVDGKEIWRRTSSGAWMAAR